MVNLDGAALYKKTIMILHGKKKKKKQNIMERRNRGREKEKRRSHTHYLLLQVKCVFVSATETAVRAPTV